MMDGVVDRRTGTDLTCLSAFSGLGGMDLGLEAAGFRHLGCIEWDESARRSIKANRGGRWQLLEPGDIEIVAQSLRPVDLGISPGDLDLLVGAPPCQPYSKAAQWSSDSRRGLEDRRGQYLDDMLVLAGVFLPKVVLLENVRGFVAGRTGALSHIEKHLELIERTHGVRYSLHHRIIDAADVGAPQHRDRAIVIATRMSTEPSWPVHSGPATAWDAIGELEQASEVLPEPKGKWAELLPSIPEGENYLWHTDRGGGLPLFGYRTRYWSFLLKLAKNRPSWTLPAQPGPATGPFHWDNRPLSIPEMLRLQTFPPDWVVEGASRVDHVRQVGNATPPLLAEELGRCTVTDLTGRSWNGPPSYAIERAVSLPPPAEPTGVAGRYLALTGEHDAHPGTGLGPAGRPASVH